MNFRVRLIVIFALIAVIPTAIVAALAFFKGKAAIKKECFNHLVSVNIYKGKQLDMWEEDSRDSLEELAHRPLVIQYAASLVTDRNRKKARSDIRQKLILNHLEPSLGYSRFTELFILCPDSGKILASTNHLQEGKFRDDSPYFIQGRSHTYVQNIYYSAILEQPAMTVGTPITDSAGNLLAVLAGRLELAELSVIMRQGRELRPTEDTYLVNLFNYFVTEPRFGKNYALKKTVHTRGVAGCLTGKNGTGFYKDYRDIPVLGAFQWLDKHKMGILTEIDQSVAFAPIYELGKWTAWFALAVTMLTAVFGFFFAGAISLPVEHLVAGTREIGRGNLDYRLNFSKKGDIGDLARAFDRMAEELKTTTVSRDEIQKLNLNLEKRVAERTQDLEDMNTFRDSIMHHSPAGIAVYHESGPCVLANQSAADMTGTLLEEFKTQNFRTLKSWKKSGLLACAVKCLESGITQKKTVQTISALKEKVWLDCRFTIFDMKNETHLLVIFNNISALKGKEAQLNYHAGRLKAANRELEAFAYSVSHDLRAPLRAIDGYTRILEEDYQHLFDEEGRRVLEVICKEAKRMGKLIDDLLAYSRLGRAEMDLSWIDMNSLVHSVFQELASPDDHQRIDFKASSLPAAFADPTLIRQVWMNLISNAIKYSSKRKAPVITVSAAPKEEETVYSVKDNGAGFDMAYEDKLFGIFQRLHTEKEFKGTGIGLANVQRAVARHGGRVWGKGETGKGAVFFFTLPQKTVETLTNLNQKETAK